MTCVYFDHGMVAAVCPAASRCMKYPVRHCAAAGSARDGTGGACALALLYGSKARTIKAANRGEAPLDAGNEQSVDFTRFVIRCAYRRQIKTSSESARRRRLNGADDCRISCEVTFRPVQTAVEWRLLQNCIYRVKHSAGPKAGRQPSFSKHFSKRATPNWVSCTPRSQGKSFCGIRTRPDARIDPAIEAGDFAGQSYAYVKTSSRPARGTNPNSPGDARNTAGSPRSPWSSAPSPWGPRRWCGLLRSRSPRR